MSNPDDRAPAPVQSVDRAISVLEFLARTGEAGITDVAAELGVHKSTVSRLVGSLQNRGLVEQVSERGKFTIGFGIVRLAGAATSQLDLAKLGTPICENLAELLGETVNIAILDGTGAINVSQARGNAAVATQNWTGQRTPLHASSSGKVLLALATSDDQEREQIVTQSLTRYTPRTITDADELRTLIGQIIEDGYATSYEELELGLHALAVPVYGRSTDVVASISASGPAYRMSRKRIREISEDLSKSALELSNQLGYFEQ